MSTTSKTQSKTTTAKAPAAKAPEANVSAVKVDAKQIDEVMAMSKQTVEKAVASTRDNVEKTVVATREQVEKASVATLKGYDDFASISKQNVDAFIKASNIFAKGFEDLSRSCMGYAQSAADKQAEAAKAMMSAKSVTEFMELQSDLARSSFDTVIAETTKLSEMTIKLANETLEPISAQANATFERLVKSAA